MHPPVFVNLHPFQMSTYLPIFITIYLSETNIYFFTLQRFGPSPSLNFILYSTDYTPSICLPTYLSKPLFIYNLPTYLPTPLYLSFSLPSTYLSPDTTSIFLPMYLGIPLYLLNVSICLSTYVPRYTPVSVECVYLPIYLCT